MQKTLGFGTRLLTQWLIVFFYLQTHSLHDTRALGVCALAATYLASSTLTLAASGIEPGSRLTAWLLAGEVIAAISLEWISTNGAVGGALILLAVTGIHASSRFCHTRKLDLLMLTSVGFTLDAALSISRGTLPWINAGMNTMLYVFFCSSAYLRSQLAQERLQALALNKQVRELAILQERDRLARDMHDSVAHQLTALLVQIQTGRRLLSRAPAQGEAHLRVAEETAREALTEVRRAVRALKPAALAAGSELAALRQLAEQFSASADALVQVETSPDLGSLPVAPLRTEALYRIAQECLTNAKRHGRATRMLIHLQQVERDLEMTVTSNGATPADLIPSFGLLSMQERASRLGGRVTFETTDRFTVRVRVPLEEAVPHDPTHAGR